MQANAKRLFVYEMVLKFGGSISEMHHKASLHVRLTLLTSYFVFVCSKNGFCVPVWQ